MHRKKIALFGGAFDPPHLGHQKVASVVTADFIDEVWFVPVFTHPWAKKYHKESLVRYEDRLQMLEFLVAKNQKIAEYRQVSFTYPTLKFFEERYPDYEFSWIMGSEYIGRFDAFLEGHPKLKNFTFYIYPRKGYPLENLHPNMVGLSQMKEIDISSTQVKELIEKKESLEDVVLPEVAAYIESHQLYQ